MSVDDRIVSMKFDNVSFERNVSETLKSLDKLRQSLDFANSTRGMNELSSASKSFSMGNVGSAVEGVSNKFLALATIGITALANITNRAVDAGLAMVKSLSFGPIIQGFQEYETNMNSIQTILANTDSKGSTLEDVNNALDELNTYADQTIYNFSEMTRNIGTFTAAGVDLDVATGAIKGIANVAAISGSNSQQASTAMYQLSQAMASGTVKLMDWNSVVNAGMGGEVFQKALFETGKAMGTIADVPLDQSFDEWKDAGNSFRNSLQDGWITAEVLTNTLQGFTGDLTKAQILSMGYTKEQAEEVMRLGKIGKDAATKVKTLTQLMDTVKEAIGSGWATTFRTVIGDFEEAKELFTNISDGIGEMVGKSANARNKMLQQWKDFGGRDALLRGFTEAIKGLGTIIAPIKEAFRDFFPKTTAEDLIKATAKFEEFAKSIKIGGETAEKIKSIFSGFFAVLEIGWEIIKGVAGVIGDLIKAFLPAGSGLFDFAANTGDTLTALNEALVAGGGIRDFFDKIGSYIEKASGYLKSFKENVTETFDAFSKSEEIEEVVGRVGDRFGMLAEIANKVADAWSWLSDRLSGVTAVLGALFSYIANWFGELGSKLAGVIKEGDFDAVVDIINVGLLGGIALLLKKFLSGGISLDFGGGLIDKINGIFDGLTGTLKSMQADLKASALMKIAGAVGILTGSVLVLSMIDSKALTKALTAMAVGFGQLMTSMMIMGKFTTGAVTFNALAAGMILLSIAIGILSIAVRNLSGLDWNELAKGLIGVTVLLGGMMASTQLLSANVAGLVRAGFAMIGISIALLILSKAVKSFATMSWEEMGKGLLGVAVGLGAITLAMRLMPTKAMLSKGLAIIAVAIGLRILANAVAAFGKISIGEMAKGLGGIGVALVAIAGAMHLMPLSMPITAAGLLLVSVALVIMAKAVKSMGSIGMGELAKGVGAFAAMLFILALGTIAMTGALPGAIALIVVAGALHILADVLKELAKLKITEILTGLGAIAGIFVVLGAAGYLLAPLTPVLLGLGLALGLVGASFALFGLGAMLVAKAFEILAKAGSAGVKVLVSMIKKLIQILPEMVGAFVSSLAAMVNEILEAAPMLIDSIKVILIHILETIVELSPHIAEALGAMITEGLKLIREKAPEIVETGMVVLLALLQGIRDNISEITSTASELITNFLIAFKENAPMVINAGVDLLISFLSGIAKRIKEVTTAGLKILVAFLNGIANNISKVVDAATNIVTKFISAIGNSATKIAKAGTDALVDFLGGISDNIEKVSTAVTGVVTKFITSVGNSWKEIAQAGTDALVDFLDGIGNNLGKVTEAVGEIITKFITSVSNESNRIITAGTFAIIDFITGIGRNLGLIILAGVNVVLSFLKGLADSALMLANGAAQVLIDFMNGLADAIRNNAEGLRAAGRNIASAILEGITGGLSAGKGGVISAVNDVAGSITGVFSGNLKIFSPSRVFMEYGRNIVDGLAVGIAKNSNAKKSTEDLGNGIVRGLKETLSHIPDKISDMGDFNPVITPVLDLTKVQADSRNIQGLLGVSSLTPGISYDRARLISAATMTQPDSDISSSRTELKEVKFEQNIYAPEALSTSDIYRSTKNQIAVAEEELSHL